MVGRKIAYLVKVMQQRTIALMQQCTVVRGGYEFRPKA